MMVYLVGSGVLVVMTGVIAARGIQLHKAAMRHPKLRKAAIFSVILKLAPDILVAFGTSALTLAVAA